MTRVEFHAFATAIALQLIPEATFATSDWCGDWQLTVKGPDYLGLIFNVDSTSRPSRIKCRATETANGSTRPTLYRYIKYTEYPVATAALDRPLEAVVKQFRTKVFELFKPTLEAAVTKWQRDLEQRRVATEVYTHLRQELGFDGRIHGGSEQYPDDEFLKTSKSLVPYDPSKPNRPHATFVPAYRSSDRYKLEFDDLDAATVQALIELARERTTAQS